MINLETLEIVEREHTANWSGFALFGKDEKNNKIVRIASLDYPTESNPNKEKYKNRERQFNSIMNLKNYLIEQNIKNCTEWIEKAPADIKTKFIYCFGETYPFY